VDAAPAPITGRKNDAAPDPFLWLTFCFKFVHFDAVPAAAR
jgi:hypothetical protein